MKGKILVLCALVLAFFAPLTLFAADDPGELVSAVSAPAADGVEIRSVIDISIKDRECRLRESTVETLPGVGQRVHLNIYCPGRLSTAWLETDVVPAEGSDRYPRDGLRC